MELALEWLESQRLVMNDPALKHYFLQYNYSTGGNGVIFNAERAEGAQYFWNYLQVDAAQYYIASVVASLADNATDGTCECEQQADPPTLAPPPHHTHSTHPPPPLPTQSLMTWMGSPQSTLTCRPRLA